MSEPFDSVRAEIWWGLARGFRGSVGVRPGARSLEHRASGLGERLKAIAHPSRLRQSLST